MSATHEARRAMGIFVVPAVLLVFACSEMRTAEAEADTAAPAAPHVSAASQVEAGRYLVRIAGCNDCHTPGALEGAMPEEAGWLVGVPVGWRGPWGTTYAKNLRLTVTNLSEDDWVSMSHSRDALPPMPWENLHALSDQDARAMYAYIQSLGPAGERMPAPLPPGQEPTTPYFSLNPIMPAK